MLLFKLKVILLKIPKINLLWRKWNISKGRYVGNYAHLSNIIKNYSKGNSFVDVGCMWGVNGEYAFIAEEAGATIIKGVDVFGPTPEFTKKKSDRNSKVEFILGDITNPKTLEKIGLVDVVFCAGVLYHHPSPFDLLAALRSICNKTLILRTFTIPEIKGLTNAAVYFPMLTKNKRKLWSLKKLGILQQMGISNQFDPSGGYGNWFWGLTPSCLKSLLVTAGFKVDFQFIEPFSQTLICTPESTPFNHKLPDRDEAEKIAKLISQKGIAKPA
jgi:hypothetical protein